jgi:hypothetical protein
MSVQQNPVNYATAIQAQLVSVCTPVPVYANFNRNFAKEPKFVTWQLRNVHQDVYTGQTQSNKGIDRPVYQMSVFAQSMSDAFNLSNTILQSLHGYTGFYGGPTGIWVAKSDVFWLYNTYDNELGLNQIILDCTLDIPT